MGEFFEMKEIPMRLRIYIEEVATLNNRYSLDWISKQIDSKSILLIDDIIASGKTLSFCAKALIDTFSPSQLIILTLLRP